MDQASPTNRPARLMMRWLALIAVLALFVAGCGSSAQPLSPPTPGLYWRVTPPATPPPERCGAASPNPGDGQADDAGGRAARFVLARVATLGTDLDVPLAFSPDGRWLALSTAVGVTLYDAPTLTPQLACPFPGGVLALAFAPDSAALTAGGITRDVATWRLPSGELAGVAALPEAGADRIAYAPDGGSFVVARYALVSLFLAGDRTPQWATTVPNSTIAGATFSADGRTIIVANAGDRNPHETIPMAVRRFDATDGRLFGEQIGPRVYRVALSPDGRLLARWSQTTDALEVVPLDDSPARPSLSVDPAQADPAARITALLFVAGGAYLAVGDAKGGIALWDLGSGQLIKRLPIHTSDVSNLATSPDGTVIASSSPGGTVRLTPIMLWR